jgi:hypothetical protein
MVYFETVSGNAKPEVARPASHARRYIRQRGEVAERFKAAVLKTVG